MQTAASACRDDGAERRTEAGALNQETVPASSALDYPFEPGQIVMGRFRVLRVIGHGGMGIVCEAIDQKLEKRIAIKCAKPGFQQQLPPEARSSTEVAHPNVCKTYEIHTVETAYGSVDFLTMEYLEGETLGGRLARDGPLPAMQAGEILRQVCEGLQEAHRRGIIHGDLKPGNIILRKTLGGLIPVITDFGLARRSTPSNPASLSSGSGGGTPPFMAPELRRGAKSSVASDIYALGVIFYQMLMGSLPPRISGTESGPIYDLKLIRREISRFGRTFRNLTLRCLQPDPLRRPAEASAIGSAIVSGTRIRRLLFRAAIVLIALLAGPFVGYQSVRNPVRLAMFQFEASPLQQRLADESFRRTAAILDQAGPRTRRLRIVKLLASATRGQSDFSNLCRSLQVTHALLVRLDGNGRGLSVRARVVDVCTQQPVRELPLEYGPEETSFIAPALAGVITGTLHLPAPRAQDAGLLNADYIAGIKSLASESEVDSAITAFSRAVKVARDSPAVWSGLAEAYRLKYKMANDEELNALALTDASKAQSLDPDAGPVWRIEGLLDMDVGRYARALDDFGRAIELDPKNPDGYLGMARVYNKMDRTREAVQAMAKAIEVAPTYPKAFRQIGSFYYDRGEFDKSIEQFKTAERLMPDSPEVYVDVAADYIKTAQYSRAEKELVGSLERGETLDAQVDMGAVLDYEGLYAKAIEHYRRAVELARNDYTSWLNLGDDYRRTGKKELAKQAYQRALQLALQEVSANPQSGDDRTFVGYLLARLGQEQQAEYEIRQAFQMPPKTAQMFRTAALTYEALGKREKTLALLQEAPYAVIHDLRQHPDTGDLCHDARFSALRDRQ